MLAIYLIEKLRSKLPLLAILACSYGNVVYEDTRLQALLSHKPKKCRNQALLLGIREDPDCSDQACHVQFPSSMPNAIQKLLPAQVAPVTLRNLH
jgi:hypothetical protein